LLLVLSVAAVVEEKLKKMNNLELIFKISAVILIIIAAFFLWRQNMDAVFVTAVIGAVCFFLSVRFQIVKKP
jgi:ABC-type nickel/cobalt efflux system permease component RcnA